ncbi:MAG TPA: PilW family protein [Dokdonella sp.]|uniref:PilW family protein n=1 Tax=Dokdonella sp. TaxID=2291710 RepID=UPI002D80A30A|nr:PilW family protein [Dokdonella sp.]HET9034245.1 PilW family protein [Dokdonella sp.]
MTNKSPEHSLNRLRSGQAGVSLIELMIGIVIAALLVLGLVQIFGASATTSQMTEGLSRVQENGRFATQFLQRQLRMVGFMGCGADTSRFIQDSFVNHLANFDATVPGGDKYRFNRPIEAYTVGTGTAPAELSSITGIVDGTDVLILRVFSEESVPVLSISKATNQLTLVVGEPDAPFLPEVNKTVLLGLQNCRSADVFAGILNGTSAGSAIVAEGLTSPNVYADPSVDNCGSAPCPWDFRISNAFLNAKPLVGDPSLNAEIHRAEYYALFVKPNAAGINSLFLMRFKRGDVELAAPEEFVEGIENMQLRFGYDTSVVADGAIDEYRTAEDVTNGATGAALDANWRRVLSVRVGMLIRSPGRAGVADRTYKVLGTDVTPTDNNGAIREVYETTIALRNRLYNS